MEHFVRGETCRGTPLGVHGWYCPRYQVHAIFGAILFHHNS